MAEELKKRLTELAGRAAERGYYIYTDFLSPTGIAVAEGLRLPVPITAFGGAEFCERRIIRFGDFGYEEEFPLRIIKISPASERFFKAVTHRDILSHTFLGKSVTAAHFTVVSLAINPNHNVNTIIRYIIKVHITFYSKAIVFNFKEINVHSGFGYFKNTIL